MYKTITVLGINACPFDKYMIFVGLLSYFLNVVVKRDSGISTANPILRIIGMLVIMTHAFSCPMAHAFNYNTQEVEAGEPLS